MANAYIEESLYRNVVILKMPFPPNPNNTVTDSGIAMIAGMSDELLKLKPLEFARQYYQDVYMDDDAMDRQYEVPLVGLVHRVSEFDEEIKTNGIKEGDYVTIENCQLNTIGTKDGYVYFSIPFRAIRGKLSLADSLEIFEKYKTGEIFTKVESKNILAEALKESSKDGNDFGSILNIT